MSTPHFRIGHGFDFHAFTREGKLIIGGVDIPYHQGIQAHSDGDVLLHAVCDALLGAAGLGDIGQHFPDTDPQYKNANSRFFLKSIVQLLTQHNYSIVNLDATIIAEKPKLTPYMPAMRKNLASDLNISPEQINIKAKTMEKLGSIGQEQGLAAHVVALIQKQLTAGKEELIPDAYAKRLIKRENPIRVWREYRKLTQAQLAKLAHISIPYLSQLEHGERQASTKTLTKIAYMLKVSPEDLKLFSG